MKLTVKLTSKFIKQNPFFDKFEEGSKVTIEGKQKQVDGDGGGMTTQDDKSKPGEHPPTPPTVP